MIDFVFFAFFYLAIGHALFWARVIRTRHRWDVLCFQEGFGFMRGMCAIESALWPFGLLV